MVEILKYPSKVLNRRKNSMNHVIHLKVEVKCKKVNNNKKSFNKKRHLEQILDYLSLEH